GSAGAGAARSVAVTRAVAVPLAAMPLAVSLGAAFRAALIVVVLAVRGGALAAAARSDDAGVGDLADEQLDGANRVVVAGDDVVEHVGIAVGVGDGDDRNLELARLGDGD